MGRLDSEKLFVEFRTGATTEKPVIGRKYTLTHSDETGNLYLTIGTEYAIDKINWMRDEVLAEWTIHDGNPLLQVYVYVDGDAGSLAPDVRDKIFRREMPLALEAIREGDKELLSRYPTLDNDPIWVNFSSNDPNYNSMEYWGTPADYKMKPESEI